MNPETITIEIKQLEFDKSKEDQASQFLSALDEIVGDLKGKDPRIDVALRRGERRGQASGSRLFRYDASGRRVHQQSQHAAAQIDFQGTGAHFKDFVVVIAPAGISAVALILGAYLRGLFGQTVRLQIGDLSAEAATPAEVEKLIAIALEAEAKRKALADNPSDLDQD